MQSTHELELMQLFQLAQDRPSIFCQMVYLSKSSTPDSVRGHYQYDAEVEPVFKCNLLLHNTNSKGLTLFLVEVFIAKEVFIFL